MEIPANPDRVEPVESTGPEAPVSSEAVAMPVEAGSPVPAIRSRQPHLSLPEQPSVASEGPTPRAAGRGSESGPPTAHRRRPNRGPPVPGRSGAGRKSRSRPKKQIASGRRSGRPREEAEGFQRRASITARSCARYRPIAYWRSTVASGRNTCVKVDCDQQACFGAFQARPVVRARGPPARGFPPRLRAGTARRGWSCPASNARFAAN